MHLTADPCDQWSQCAESRKNKEKDLTSSPYHHLSFSFFDQHEALKYKRQKQQKCMFQDQVGEMSHVFKQGRFIIPFPGEMWWLQLLWQLPGKKESSNIFISEDVSFSLKKLGYSPSQRHHSSQNNTFLSMWGKKMRNMATLSSTHRWVKTKRQQWTQLDPAHHVHPFLFTPDENHQRQWLGVCARLRQCINSPRTLIMTLKGPPRQSLDQRTFSCHTCR